MTLEVETGRREPLASDSEGRAIGGSLPRRTAVRFDPPAENYADKLSGLLQDARLDAMLDPPAHRSLGDSGDPVHEITRVLRQRSNGEVIAEGIDLGVSKKVANQWACKPLFEALEREKGRLRLKKKEAVPLPTASLTPKARLNNYAQEHKLPLPKYRTKNFWSDQAQQLWSATCEQRHPKAANGKVVREGNASAVKKEAEQNAAEAVLAELELLDSQTD